MNLQEQLEIQRMYDQEIKNAKQAEGTKSSEAPKRGRPPKLQPPAERGVPAAFAAHETPEA